MQLEKPADTQSPWYEAFSTASAAGQPVRWIVVAEAAVRAAEPPDEDWATEALFDYYND